MNTFFAKSGVAIAVAFTAALATADAAAFSARAPKHPGPCTKTVPS